jgi:hypothetical protein
VNIDLCGNIRRDRSSSDGPPRRSAGKIRVG